jgi:hypothetical protein
MKTEMYISFEHKILPSDAPSDMPISTISMLRVISTVQSLLLRFGLKLSRRPKLAKFLVNWLAVLEPWNNHLNKDASMCHVKTEIERYIKQLRNFYLVVLLHSQVNMGRTQLLIHFFGPGLPYSMYCLLECEHTKKCPSWPFGKWH